MTVSELKRVAQGYTWEVIYNSIHNGGAPEDIRPNARGLRTVDRFQRNDIAFRMPDGSRSWLHFKSAKEFSFAEDGTHLLVTVRPNPADYPQHEAIQRGEAKIIYRLVPVASEGRDA